MHKSTIFLTILAFFSVTFLLEQNYQPEINNTDLISANSAYFQTNQSENKETNPNESAEGFFEDFIKTSPEEKSENTKPEEKELSQDTELVTSRDSLVKKYFHAIAIDDLEIEDWSQEKLFDVVSFEGVNSLDKYQYKFTKRGSKMAEVNELKFDDLIESNKAYSYIQAVALSFDGININKNNQFNDSFYINNPSKPYQVYLVIKKENRIFTFTYLKDLHESFKGFYEILL